MCAVIHYHGTPITPNAAAVAAIKCGHAFISYRRAEQLGLAIELCQSFAVDNGAFSAWKSGKPVTDWSNYYEWVAALHRIPNFDFAVIPDVIDGDEQANDDLLAEWCWTSPKDRWIGAPVWHMHESIERLVRLASDWQRVCIGSSGDYSKVGNVVWWQRMREAINAVTDKEGRPICKLHGLRMLNVDIFSNLPLSSADSTNLARNVGIDQKWTGRYTPANNETRALVMRGRIESHQALSLWTKENYQGSLI